MCKNILVYIGISLPHSLSFTFVYFITLTHSFTSVLFPDFLDHFLISFNNKRSYIPAFFAVVNRTCIPANFII